MHHISGKDPGSLLEIRLGYMVKLLSSYISLLQKVFVEIKHKLRRTINFVRPIGKNVNGIILEVVKNSY